MKVLKIANKIQRIETELICFGSNSKLENEQRKLANKLAKKVLAKWQQERSYSEEEVLDLLCARNIEFNLYEGRDKVEQWFEQFKNK